MQAIYAPMILPLALYRFWAGIFFSPPKNGDTAINAATMMPVEVANSAKQLKRAGRRPHYVSARIRKAQRDAG